jgi:hypothetical protein
VGKGTSNEDVVVKNSPLRATLDCRDVMMKDDDNKNHNIAIQQY